MSISRRTALIGAGLLLSRQVRAAEDKDEQRALFWTVTPPGRKGGVLFGYERIAAAITPEIVRDGEALAGASQRIVIDMPQRVRFPQLSLGAGDIKPIVQIVSPQTADRLRKFLAATPAASRADRLGGLEATMLLVVEGQHNADITVGGTIFEYSRSAGKPVDQLLSDTDVLSAFRPPDMAALNGGSGQDTISYLLDLRDRIGPIGGYLEQLYRERKGDAIVRVADDINRHGVFSPSRLLQTDQIRNLMFERAQDMLTQQADEQRFMLFPLGMLAGSTGLLAAFKAKGAEVVPRA
jgi:hypothetical protein